MKNRFLFLVGIGALLAMSSCSKDEENLVVKSGEPATLSLTIKGSDLSTKATTTASELATAGENFDNTITRVTVGLFKKGGTLEGLTDVIQEGALVSGKILVKGSIISNESADRDIVVVANAEAEYFKGISNKSTFLAKIMTLTQTKTLLPMAGTGTGTLTKTINNTGTGDGTASITITRLVARVQLTSLKTDFDPAGQYPDATFTADAIFMYNAVKELKVDGSITSTTPLPLIDGRTYTEGSPAQATMIDNFTPVMLVPESPSAYTTYHYFYTFPNDLHLLNNYDKATRLVIRGTFDPDGNPVTTPNPIVFYPVIVNYFANPTADQIPANGYNNGIVQNKIYSISVTIKNRGVDNPDIIIDPAYLNVSVTVASWALNINQPVEF